MCNLEPAAVGLMLECSPPDINECGTNNGGCAHNCTNNQGSFMCSCRSGFQLASDGMGCDGKALLCAIWSLQL